MMPLLPGPGLRLCVAGATLGAVGLVGQILELDALTTIVETPGRHYSVVLDPLVHLRA
jgi:hypothetical protein